MPEHDPAALLAALAGLELGPAPSMEARERMRAALMAKLPPAARAPTTHVLRKDDGEWRALLPGVRIKTLRSDPVGGTATTLWQVEPGASVPPHVHHHEEECLVLEGSIIKDGVEYFPGDYLLAEVGEAHASFHSPRGAVFLIRGELVPDAQPRR